MRTPLVAALACAWIFVVLVLSAFGCIPQTGVGGGAAPVDLPVAIQAGDATAVLAGQNRVNQALLEVTPSDGPFVIAPGLFAQSPGGDVPDFFIVSTGRVIDSAGDELMICGMDMAKLGTLKTGTKLPVAVLPADSPFLKLSQYVRTADPKPEWAEVQTACWMLGSDPPLVAFDGLRLKVTITSSDGSISVTEQQFARTKEVAKACEMLTKAGYDTSTITAFREMGAWANEMLDAVAANTDQRAIGQALTDLWSLVNFPGVAERIGELALSHPEARIRQRFMHALSRELPPATAANHLAMLAAKERDKKLRWEATRKLADLDDWRAVPLLIDWLRDPENTAGDGVALAVLRRLALTKPNRDMPMAPGNAVTFADWLAWWSHGKGDATIAKLPAAEAIRERLESGSTTVDQVDTHIREGLASNDPHALSETLRALKTRVHDAPMGEAISGETLAVVLAFVLRPDAPDHLRGAVIELVPALMAPADALELLVSYVNESKLSDYMQRYAARAMRELPVELAAPVLGEWLTKAGLDRQVRHYAREGLIGFGRKSYVAPFMWPAIKNSDVPEAERQLTMTGIWQMVNQAKSVQEPYLDEIFANARQIACDRMQPVGVRAEAARLLVEAKAPADRELFRDLADDANSQAQIRGVEGLAAIADPADREFLLSIAGWKGRHRSARQAAFQGLRTIGDKTVVAKLMDIVLAEKSSSYLHGLSELWVTLRELTGATEVPARAESWLAWWERNRRPEFGADR